LLSKQFFSKTSSDIVTHPIDSLSEDIFLETNQETEISVCSISNIHFSCFFQTQNNTMGEQYVDLERARNTKKCVVVDPFNRILVPGVPSPAFREKLYENAPPANDGRDTRFPCPKCSKSFGRLHTVVQHLTKGN